MLISVFKGLEAEEKAKKVDKYERGIMQRKLIECHAALKYYRRDKMSKANPLTSVTASYKHL
jgi:hypothetical protein